MIMKMYYSILVCLLTFAVQSNAQDTQGFFLNDFAPKSATVPAYTEYAKPASTNVTVAADMGNVVTKVSKYLFGNNANLYMTQMVDQPGLLGNIKTLSPQLIRFPGGNLSSVYFWNAAPGHPPADAPLKLIDADGKEQDAGYWYGKNTDGWTLSLDNYYKMLDQTASKGMITINYGYARYSTSSNPVAAAAHLAADWVRYDNGRTKFWEIGNESNGTWQAGYRINTLANKDQQPQLITGDVYGTHFKIFADSMRKAAKEIGTTIYIGAQLLQEEPASWATATDKSWNQGVFQKAANVPDYYIIHSYYTPFQTNSSPADILTTASKVTTDMMTYVKAAMTTAGVTVKPVALTEWNIFAEGSKQQVSYVNGMHAAIVLGELIKNKYGQASRWDLANAWGNGNDHGMFSNGDEPGGIPRWNPRPVYHYMYYFQKYFGDQMVSSTVTGNTDVIAYVSKFTSGEAGLVIINKGITEQNIAVNLSNFGYGNRYYMYTLTGGTDNGDFSLKVNVNGQGPTLSTGGPPDVENIKSRSSLITDGVKLLAPKRSVTYVLIENGNNIITSVRESKTDEVKVYPNPSANGFEVEMTTAGFTSVLLTDASGKEIIRMTIDPSQTRVSIPKNDLAKGIYYLKLIRKKEVIYRKVEVQ